MSSPNAANRPHATGPRKAQGGFVITVELLLLVTILVLGSLVGIVAIRDALVKRYVSQQAQKAIVVDAQGKVLGEAADFDEHDAPRLFYIDRSQARNYRTLIGIRDDRFTSREPLYYAGNSCEGEPCIKRVSDESSDNDGVDGISGSGSVSYFNALQGQPNYAVGQGAGGLPGALYRETAQSCPIAVADIGSRWISQKVVAGSPCEAIALEATGTEPAYSACLVSVPEPCDCPADYEDEGDVLDNYLPAINDRMDSIRTGINLLLPPGQRLDPVEVGSLCCPQALSLQTEELVDAAVFVAINRVLAESNVNDNVKPLIDEILAPLQGEILCEAFVQLQATAPVADPNDPTRNALEAFAAPFRVNLPAAAGDSAWRTVAPTGEGSFAP
ncbi:hypothetical protein I0D00_18855 [Pseudomonas lalucatii]|uniref:Uncharacterized protein n=1 Tax=Pseudomonas lalucatii TaxID=1424203 RepID=A0ABS5Q5Y8_9PSED|nr:hypothetical protein [Pseudomonas lalucatii]MBS7663988.1 hypothetical protein [Pseudomonas lalucatii]MBS7725345.1 hypothetical protein [Pseudomonas lalucatii]QVM86706.1 hypothetical protein I0D68_13125 [Pseudomonas lalucatii]